MSSEPVKTPSLRWLLLIGTAALAIAGAIAANGIIDRAHGARALVQWTDKQAIPTVALAKLAPGTEVRDLTLPGTIQAYNKASIYARVSGYLTRWQQDIGAPATTAQLLSTIDTP